MTLEQFDQVLGYLLNVILPPNVSDDLPVTREQVLDVLERHCDQLRGEIIRSTK